MPVQTNPAVEDAMDAVEPASAIDDDDGDRGDEASATAESAPDQDDADEQPASTGRRSRGRCRILAYGVLPGLVMLLALAAGLFKFWDSSVRDTQTARIESVQAAEDSTVAMLSYQPDTVEKDLTAAQDRLTGAFRDSYTELTHDVVIPGAKQKHIATVANVSAAASVSATPNHAVVLVFVNQAAIVGSDTPTDTASSVRVTLDKIDGRWLISGFDPV